jgi:hypothetical protein
MSEWVGTWELRVGNEHRGSAKRITFSYSGASGPTCRLCVDRFCLHSVRELEWKWKPEEMGPSSSFLQPFDSSIAHVDLVDVYYQ